MAIQSSRLLLERRLTLLFGADSPSMDALRFVMKEMSAKKGYKRYDGSDYYMHCVDVTNFLVSYGIRDQDTLVAGLLHDIIEDVPGHSRESLACLFGERAAGFVYAVTNKPGLDYHDPQVLRAHLRDIAEDMNTACIKTADRMHNMYTLSEASIEKRYKKALETEEFFIPFFKDCRRRYPAREDLFQAAKTQILPQIYEIKSHYVDYCRLQEALGGKKHDVVPSAQ